MLTTDLPGEPVPPRRQRILNWLRHNKIKSLFGVLLLWMFFEVLFLPLGDQQAEIGQPDGNGIYAPP